jgi:hypothetical protein
VIIGSDQAAVRGATILGKPGSVDAAIAQLQAASGAQIVFHTAAHVIVPQHQRHEAHIDATVVKFRTLSDEEIVRYVAAENPLDCAGAFKAEALGITLFERIDSQDPTALTGLPPIWLACAAAGGFAAWGDPWVALFEFGVCQEACLALLSQRLQTMARINSSLSGAVTLNFSPVAGWTNSSEWACRNMRRKPNARSASLPSLLPYFSSPATGCPA